MIGRAPPGARAAPGAAGRLCPRGSPPKFRPGSPLGGAAWKRDLPRLEGESSVGLNLGESLGVSQQGGGVGKKGIPACGSGAHSPGRRQWGSSYATGSWRGFWAGIGGE